MAAKEQAELIPEVAPFDIQIMYDKS